MLLLEKTPSAGCGTSAQDSWLQMAQQLAEATSETGAWRRWGESHTDGGWPSSLLDACEQRRTSESACRHMVVATLCRVGCRRGGDDDDAALAAVVILDPGVRRLAGRLQDLCTLDDVRAAVWETIKQAEPHLGPRAPRFMLRRAQRRLLRPGAGFLRPRDERVSLDAVVADGALDDQGTGELALCDPSSELGDLLDWASASGVLRADQARFVRELAEAAAYVSVDQAANELGVRRGVSARTARRHRAEVLAKLRDAVPAYLAETA